MCIKSIIAEIETYFRLFPFEKGTKQAASSQNPLGMPSGGFPDKGFRFVSEEKEKAVLLQHLGQMDDEALDQLIDELGEESCYNIYYSGQSEAIMVASETKECIKSVNFRAMY